MNVEKNILNGAKALFMQFGLKSITMDDIAKKVGVSKKTIYQYYKDKGSIVLNSVKAHFSEHEHEINAAIESSSNAIEALMNISKCMKKQVESSNPSVLYDLQRYFPKSHKRFLEFRDGFMSSNLKKILESGMSDGMFRTDLDVDVLVKLRIVQVETAFDSEVFPPDKFDFRKVQMQLFDHYIHGILTDKGREIFNQQIEKEHEA